MIIKYLIIALVLLLSINNVNAQIVNGDFEWEDELDGWACGGYRSDGGEGGCGAWDYWGGDVSEIAHDSGECAKIHSYINQYGGADLYHYVYIYQENVNLSGYDNLEFDSYSDPYIFATTILWINDNIVLGSHSGSYEWKHYSYNVSEYEGLHTIKLGTTSHKTTDFYTNNIAFYDNVELTSEAIPITIQLDFIDSCYNLLPLAAGSYYKSGDFMSLFFYAETGSLPLTLNEGQSLELWVDSDIGTLYYMIDNPTDSMLCYIMNPTISFTNDIILKDGITGDYIPNALVSISQDCYIGNYPTRNKYTDSNGKASFTGCELDSFALNITKSGWQTFSGTIQPSALHSFNTRQIVTVTTYPTDEPEEEPEGNVTDYITQIKFKNVDGNYATSILDTDDYVDLYYTNNNTEGTLMLLRLEKAYSGSSNYFSLMSWGIPCGESGYKRILKSNYTDYTASYRARLYASLIEGWDKIEYLDVTNSTIEEESGYENLSTILWFYNKNTEGSIDYREDIKIIAYANTTYAYLFETSLELYKGGIYIDHINLTWADYIGADTKYYYEWYPDFSYENNEDYTVRMFGYDYYLLDIDHINAVDYRKNKLTIIVKDELGNNLNNAYIYLEGYGSLSTGSTYYNTYENLDNGEYRYKATKSGYTDSGWDYVTLSDGDKTVTYTLNQGADETANNIPLKTSDDDLKSLYFPLMFIMFIFMLLGAFNYLMGGT